MSERRALSNERELAAIMNNIKEQRGLQGNIRKIDLEQNHAIKLLELDERIVQVGYRHMKNKVSKIKSYLDPEDVAELRKLELEGKWKCPMTLPPSSAVTIAAAARRLNLEKDAERRQSKPKLKLQRPKSASPTSSGTTPSSIKPVLKTRPQTAGIIRNMVPVVPQSLRQVKSAQPRSNNVTNDLGVDQFEERRTNLLTAETRYGQRLNERSHYFIKDVQHFVEKGPQYDLTVCEQDTIRHRIVSAPNLSLKERLCRNNPDYNPVLWGSRAPSATKRKRLDSERKKANITPQDFQQYWNYLNHERRTFGGGEKDNMLMLSASLQALNVS